MISHYSRANIAHPPVLTKTHKDCTKCGEIKLLTDFHVAKGCRGNRHAWCKECRKDGKYDSLTNKKTKLRLTYGLSWDEYQGLWRLQDGLCGACQLPLTEDRFTHVDHDHDSGKVRGLLCLGCNTALGLLSENPDRIQGLLRYLEND